MEAINYHIPLHFPDIAILSEIALERVYVVKDSVCLLGKSQHVCQEFTLELSYGSYQPMNGPAGQRSSPAPLF